MTGSHEVRGSIPLSSTMKINGLCGFELKTTADLTTT